MTSRDWYIARSAGLRLLMVLALAWWTMVIVFAVKTWNQPVGDSTWEDQLLNFLLSGPH